MELANEEILKFDGTFFVTQKGQASGKTNGRLVHNSTSFRCDFERFPGFYFYFKNCYEIQDIVDRKPFFKSGDSGSGVLITKPDGKLYPLGIAFARQIDGDITLVCKISPIIKECNLVIYEEEVQMEIEN